MHFARDVYWHGGLNQARAASPPQARLHYILSVANYAVLLKQPAWRDSWQDELPLADRHARRRRHGGKRTT